MCKYWKWASKISCDIFQYSCMKPALSVIDTKGHSWACQANSGIYLLISHCYFLQASFSGHEVSFLNQGISMFTVLFGDRWQDGTAMSTREEVEQINSYQVHAPRRYGHAWLHFR